jgi:predicted  nucleic acid-binding Zn-ribbon protein
MSAAEEMGRLLDLDRWIERVRAQREHLAEHDELRGVERELASLAERLGALDEERKPTRAAFEEATERAESLRRRKAELEARLSAATAPARELAAMTQELANLARRLSDAEDAEVALLIEIEPMDEVAEQIRASASPLAQRRRDLHEAITQLTSTLDEELASLRSDRERAAAAVPAPWRQRYEDAMARAGVSGAARLDGERCDGCRIALTPLERDRLRSLPEGELMACPSCGRLLVP